MAAHEQQVVRAFARQYIGGTLHLCRLLEARAITVMPWSAGRARPSRKMVTRMCRLLMWGAVDWPREARVHWTEMTVSGGAPDFFTLYGGTRFSYGGKRDGGALIRDAMKWLGLEHKNHLGRLLGVPERKQYQTVMDWYNGRRGCSSRYLLRLLSLLLWSWLGYPVADMWAIDWELRAVEWAWDGKSLAPKPLPGSPFEWLALVGQPAERTRKRVSTVEPMPVSMWAKHTRDPSSAVTANGVAVRGLGELALNGATPSPVEDPVPGKTLRRGLAARVRRALEPTKAEDDPARRERRRREAEEARRLDESERRAQAQTAVEQARQHEQYVRDTVDKYRGYGWVLPEDVKRDAEKLGIA